MTLFRFISRITLPTLLCGSLLVAASAQSQPQSDQNAGTSAEDRKMSPVGASAQSGNPKTKGVSSNSLSNQPSANASDSKSFADYAMVPLSGFVRLSDSKSGKSTENSAATWATIVTACLWPIVTLVVVLRLLKEPQIKLALTKLSRRVTQLKVAGLEIELSEGAVATLDDLQKLIGQIPETQSDWLSNTHLNAQFRFVVTDIQQYLLTQNPDFVFALSKDDLDKFRFTIHVQDVLLRHSFRQLVDYVGYERGNRGRIFSSRRGIVGLTWRLEESSFECAEFTEDDLIRKWGMTRDEAKDTSKKKSVLLSFVIKNDQGLPLAVLYADAADSKLFDPDRSTTLKPLETFKHLEAKVFEFCKNRGLTDSLQKLEDARIKIKQMDIYKPLDS